MKRLREQLPKVLMMVGVLAALAIPLMFLLEDFVREAIVEPMAYQIWLARVIVSALPQAVFLIGFLPILLYIAVRSLRGGNVKVWESQKKERSSGGNLQTWLQRMELVTEGSYSKERFDHQLGQLLLQIIAHQQRLPMRETVYSIENGTIDVPSDIELYIQAALRTGFSGARKPFQWLRDLFQRRRTGMTPDELKAHVIPALQYIENQLRIQSVEVNHDR
jgi:hypothetical protein